MTWLDLIQHFKNNFLKYTLIPLLLLMVAASYVRFLDTHDHLVSYEISCDPNLSSCYILCEDETVSDISYCPLNSIFYYAVMERNAADLINYCGESIIDCKMAEECTEAETECATIYCDQETESEYCDQIQDTVNFLPTNNHTGV